MAHRLSKIVTRTGDDGTTGLASGARLRKDHARVAALGEVDELNSVIGVVLAETLPDDARSVLLEVQHDLFDLGGELSLPGHALIAERHLARLEHHVACFNADLPPLKEFILPGGSRAAAWTHVARTVCRRAERAVAALAQGTPSPALPGQYLNRLSDLLFVLARLMNRRSGTADVLWQQRRES